MIENCCYCYGEIEENEDSLYCGMVELSYLGSDFTICGYAHPLCRRLWDPVAFRLRTGKMPTPGWMRDIFQGFLFTIGAYWPGGVRWRGNRWFEAVEWADPIIWALEDALAEETKPYKGRCRVLISADDAKYDRITGNDVTLTLHVLFVGMLQSASSSAVLKVPDYINFWEPSTDLYERFLAFVGEAIRLLPQSVFDAVMNRMNEYLYFDEKPQSETDGRD